MVNSRLSISSRSTLEYSDDDRVWMRRALELAKVAASTEEVPVGAVLVRGPEVLAEAHNRTVVDTDSTSHAELLTIRSASIDQGDWRLLGTTLYVTLEPCAMCAGAIVLSRIPRVVYAASDPRAGMAGSLGNLLQEPRLNHRCEVMSGLLAEESAEILRAFFQDLR
ncbi:MAG TPA: tRNA adenosine(34) deaminase TadA [Gemmatimonadetes bacterium]|nr:tRNA adenosine(34) deaminase TadA [Gemmatimonadota bacterium]HIB09987.1 tRNA adenosine(34) deaminase TadA [Gemmatimonadota bacterium]HIC16276.1 tRNA adenosine(34) deaminase TadA [Gemmatimonadota bacterium]HIN77819.1 tRNA adenosine(34) deaminase TadA [Gemmatimonadota bacterium]